MAKLHPDRFLSYVEALSNGKDPLESLDGDEKRLLDLSLKYRLYSGKISIYESMIPHDAPDCETFGVIQKESFCNPQNLLAAIKNAKIDSTPIYGHVIGSGPRVIIYSKIGSQSWLPFHTALKPLIQQNKIECVYRHLVRRCSSDEKILGFGMELEIKEYGPEIEHDEYELMDPDGVDFELIGQQAVQMILSAKDPLSTLSFLAENAPLLAKHLSSVKPEPSVSEKVKKLAEHFNLPETMIVINGADVQSANFDLQSLLEFLVEYTGLVKRYLSRQSLEHGSTLGRQIMHSMLQPQAIRFDIRSGASIWLNDLERDRLYTQWPRALKALMRPPTGQFYPLARNLVIMTVVVDIQKLELKIVEDLFQLLQQSIPIRVAMIIHGDSRVSQILYTVSARYGTAPFLELLRRYLKEGRPDIDVLFDDVAKEMNLKIGLPLEDLIILTKAKDRAAEAILFTKRFDIESSPTIFVNGRYIPYDPSTWIREVINTYQEEIYNVQMSIVAQELDDDSEYFELIMDEERTYPSRHRAVFSIEESFMDTVPMDTFPMDAVSMDTIPMDTAPMDTFPMDAVSMDTVPMDTFPMDAVSMDTIPMGKGEWSYSDRATDNCAFSVALYLDVDRKVDISMAKVWLTAVNKTERKMRLIILPLSGKNENIKVFWKLAHGHITASEALKELQDPTKEVIDEKVLESWITANSEKARSATKLLKDGPVVAINGHLYGPFNDANVKVASWLQYEWQRRTERLQLLRMKSGLERNPTSLTLMTLFEGRLKELLDRYPSLFNGKAGMQIPTEKVNHFVHRSSDAALLHLTTMVNPFSTSAAKIAAILLELQELIEVTTIINALPAYTDSPLKGLCRFRRFDGSLQPLSKDAKFAMTLNVPAAWDVDGASDETDMDNMKIGDQVKVTLRKLLLEGEIKPHKGGRGLPNIPVELVDDHENVVDRSVAISFDGYAQLRALPGIYELRIPPNSGDIHMERKPIFLDSIAINKIEFNVKIGSEFLAERIRVPQLFADKIDKEINIFTIASGASYERLARIMILSVIKNTNSPVKFWLISTYTTSRFRQNLETMSKKYNFSYEFLSFKWPVWLTPQWRKHRRVWAQKILFLDSFPATIRRLIYIDADQVVRGDVAELAKIDLDGHVYGFVPFCESRAESAAIRFWRTGYWAEHLGGRPYHISALFVVDMVAFRAQAVGDRLRTHYQALVMDPNSLANLDQDLPNNMQRDVPIFSLPKEWLWCETWCAEEEKGRAKSIDLCSNPLKKEDKLTQGRRIITEWNIYDTEILKILGTDDVLNEAPTHNNDGVDIDVDIVQIQDQDHDHDEL